MKKIKVNQNGMTLVEVLIAMTLFTIMFMMISTMMYASLKLNAQTRRYDEETDVQIEDVERYNPMGAVVDGITSSSTDISEYGGPNSTGANKYEMTFTFPNTGKVILIDGYAYQADSKDEANGFSLKFFNSTRPDKTMGKYWIRVINVSSADNQKIYLYLPKSDHGSFYLKNESEPYTAVLTKNVPKQTALAVGFDSDGAASDSYFWVSTIADMSYDELDTRLDEQEFKKVNAANLLSTYDNDGDGFIDIYYTDDGFMSTDQYNAYKTSGIVP